MKKRVTTVNPRTLLGRIWAISSLIVLTACATQGRFNQPGAGNAAASHPAETHTGTGVRSTTEDLSDPTLPEARRLLLRNVRVFDVTSGTMSAGRDILIEGGRITAVGQLNQLTGSPRKVDCSGRFAIPGLFDCHTHLAFLSAEGGEDHVLKVLAEFVAKGITQVRDVGGPVDVLSKMATRISSAEIVGPELFFTGPMLEHSPMHWSKFNEKLPGFTVAIDTQEDVDRVLLDLAAQGACMVKTFNKIDMEVFRHLVDTAKRHSLRVVHDPGSVLFQWVPMDAAMELGITSIEHAKAPWPVVLKDELKRKHDTLIFKGDEDKEKADFTAQIIELGVKSVCPSRLQGLIKEMVKKNVWLCATLDVFVQMEVAPQSPNQSTEEYDAKRKKLALLKEVNVHFTREMARSGVRLLVGQDGHSPAATFREMRHLKDCGVAEAEIIRGATIYPAQWLGVEHRFGSIAAGKQANILLVNDNPLENIENMQSTFLVVHKGRIAFRESDPDG